MEGMQHGSPAPQQRAGRRVHPALLPAAVAAYVSCAAFFIGADEWDPLASWGLGILLVSAVAIGLVGGRWRMLFAALTVVALAPLTTADEPPLFFALVVPVLLIVCAALIALGVWLRMRIRRRGAAAERRAT